jgi:steroid delta-isomerase-like uncharacterized protein
MKSSHLRFLLLSALVFFCLIAGCQKQPQDAISRAEARALGNLWLQAVNEGKLDLFDQVYLPNAVIHEPGMPKPFQGLKELKAFFATDLAAFSNQKWTLDEMYIDGDRVFWIYSYTGTNTGPMGEMPATGKSVREVGVAVDRISAGKIAEEWVYYDTLDLMTQLGMTLVPPASPKK